MRRQWIESLVRGALFAILAAVATPVAAQETAWGDLSGKILVKGKTPPRKEIKVSKDRDYFKNPIFDDSLLVDPKTKGLANALVYLMPKKGEELAVHPSYAKTAETKVRLSIKGGQVQPHILLLRTTQTMVQANDDEVGHNLKIDFFRNSPM